MKAILAKIGFFVKHRLRVFLSKREAWNVRRDGRFGIIYFEEGLGEVHLEGELLPLSGSWFLNEASITGSRSSSETVIDEQKAHEISERVQLYFRRKGIVLHLVGK
jgi:hypothetical protein